MKGGRSHWLPHLVVGGLTIFPLTGFAQFIPDAFSQGKGHVSVSASTTTETAHSFYRSKTEVNFPKGQATTDTCNLFIAYGLADSIDLVGIVPYTSSALLGPKGDKDLNGFGDGSLTLKWRLLQHEARLLGTGWLSLASATGLQAPLSNYNGNAFPSLGHHATSLEERLIVQYIWARGLFAVLEGGYTARDGSRPDSIPLSAKLGYFGKPFYLEGWVDRQIGRGGVNVGQGPFSKTGQDYLVAGGRGIFYVLDSLGVNLAGSTTLLGRNVQKKTSYSVGLVYRPE